MKFVVVDTDGGFDDCLALFLALAAHKDPQVPFRLLGITCVNGNTTLDNVCANVQRTLHAAEVTDVPVFRGSESPLVRPFQMPAGRTPFNGWNGFGDVELPPLDTKVVIQDEPAVLALIRLAKEYKGQLSVVALGPLTNLAIAVRLDPTISNDIKEIYLMGGNCQGVGNVSMCVEFNFAVDPDAAFVTLHSFACPIVMVPWELCKDKRKTFTDFRVESMGRLDNAKMNLLNRIEARLLSGPIGWSPTDAIAMAVLLQPSLITESNEVYCTIEVSGVHSRGLVVIDHENRLQNPRNVRIVTATEDEGLKKLLLWAVGGQVQNPLLLN